MKYDTLDVVLGLIILVTIYGSLWDYGRTTITADCERLGSFYVGSKVYECKLKESK